MTGVVVVVTYDVTRHEVFIKPLDCKPWQPAKQAKIHSCGFSFNPFVCERASTRASKYGQYLDKIFSQTRRIKYQTPLKSKLRCFSNFSAILVSFGGNFVVFSQVSSRERYTRIFWDFKNGSTTIYDRGSRCNHYEFTL